MSYAKQVSINYNFTLPLIDRIKLLRQNFNSVFHNVQCITELTSRASCSCGICGYESPDCSYYLSNLCKDKRGEKDPNYLSNGCINCPNFRQTCGESCNYCPNPLTTVPPVTPITYSSTTSMVTTASPHNTGQGNAMDMFDPFSKY